MELVKAFTTYLMSVSKERIFDRIVVQTDDGFLNKCLVLGAVAGPIEGAGIMNDMKSFLTSVGGYSPVCVFNRNIHGRYGVVHHNIELATSGQVLVLFVLDDFNSLGIVTPCKKVLETKSVLFTRQGFFNFFAKKFGVANEAPPVFLKLDQMHQTVSKKSVSKKSVSRVRQVRRHIKKLFDKDYSRSVDAV